MTKHFSFLGKGLTEVPGFDLPPVEDLLWGQTVSGNPFPFPSIHKQLCGVLNLSNVERQ